MKASTIMKCAEKHRAAMKSYLAEISKQISELLDSEDVDVLYQSGDGWVVVFNDGINSKLSFGDFDKLICMSRVEAIEFLLSKQSNFY